MFPVYVRIVLYVHFKGKDLPVAKPIIGKNHVGERRKKRPNGDIYVYSRITAYNEKPQKTYMVTQKLKGKIKFGTQEIVPTPSKKRKSTGGVVKTTRQHTSLTDIINGQKQAVFEVPGDRY